jgi:hypothetical protein
VRALDAGWKQMAERLQSAGADAKVSLDIQPNGRVKLNVEKLGALGEPKSLAWLRKRVEKMLPKIDLPDLLFEVHSWTGFLDALCSCAIDPYVRPWCAPVLGPRKQKSKGRAEVESEKQRRVHDRQARGTGREGRARRADPAQ